MDHHFEGDESEEVAAATRPKSPYRIQVGSWQDYFDVHEFIEIEEGQNELSVYSRAFEPDKEQPLVFLIHGAGYSALSFATLTKHLITEMSDVAIVAMDMRSHGLSKGNWDASCSLDALVAEAKEVLSHYQRQCYARHPVILAGHSLGGAVAVQVSLSLKDICIGLVLIDIVEETSLLAINSMPSYLRSRVSEWSSPEEAIHWALASKHNRDPEAACISMPDQLRQKDNGQWTWKVDLMESEACWNGWFTGLSAAFLSSSANKLLVLAEREYLDKTLMIASMQGKFQCSIIRDSGHAIQEDQPEKLAHIMASFLRRLLTMDHLNSRRSIPDH